MLVAALMALTACSTRFDTLLPDRRPDYRQSKPAQRLEVPPDLTSSTIDDTFSPSLVARCDAGRGTDGADGADGLFHPL